ncbi:hypothetical protein [Nocardiopsis tropica]|uniref:Uncharacterized protein n=1 Tax=Nocardiopsis tropica TaxID=109330 RepID=A0ABU7KRB2_9ACTN|nr:hypothetical protein [Nocardiopsis umidischolae]MEE2051831.1 hypothetical protein [Nocardiopsis umidischolae]
MKLFSRRPDPAAARRARQLPLTEAEHEEIVQVCGEALAARWSENKVIETRSTRGGFIVRGYGRFDPAGPIMLNALAPLGYVAEPYQAQGGLFHSVLVTGTDPLHRLDGRAVEDVQEAIEALTSRMAYIGHVTGGGR